MPDGTIVSGIPDDVDPSAVVKLYVAHLKGDRDAQLAPDVSGLTAAAYAAKGMLDRTASGVRDLLATPAKTEHIGPLPIVNPESILAHKLGNTLVSGLDSAGQMLGMPTTHEARENTQVAKAIAEDHPLANFAGNAAFMAPFGGPVGQAALAAAQEGTPMERLMRGALTFGFAKGGEKLGEVIGHALEGKAPPAHVTLARGTADKGMDYAREQTLDAMSKNGLVAPPSQANPNDPGIVNRVLEGISGKIQTQQQASILNQPRVNQMVKADLGLDPSAPITLQAMKTLRDNAGKAYDAVAKSGPVHVDNQFQGELGQAVAPYLLLKGSFPDSVGNKAIEGLTKDLAGKSELDSGAVVNLLRYLRSHGFANIMSADPGTKDLGIVQTKVARSLEDLLERNLEASGQPALLTAFRTARALIAKTYSAQDALEESTGKVIAGKLAQQLAKGKPLSGNMETIAKAAQTFPKAFQNVNSSMPGLSPWDMGSSIVLGGFGGPRAALAPLARPFIRDMILSPAYQSAMVLPRAGVTAGGPLLPLLGNVSPLAQEFLPPAGALLGATGAQTALHRNR